MNISRNNYEEFFIDYIDGSLNSLQITELMKFLSKNADLKFELDNFENFAFKPEPILYSEKENLKKRPQEKNFAINNNELDNYCIAKMEGDLTAENEADFDNFLIKNPDKQKTFDLYKKTIIQPDLNIKFENKSLLKKLSLAQKRKRVLYSTISIAASIAIFLTIYFNLPETNTQNNLNNANNEIVNNESDVENSSNKNIAVVPDNQNITQKNTNNSIINSSNNRNNQIIKKIEAKAIQISNNLNSIQISKNKELPILNIKAKEINLQNSNNIYAGLVIQNTETEFIEGQYLTSTQKLAKKIKTDILKIDGTKRKPLTIWSLADAGINGLNKISGGNMKLERNFDKDGKLTAIAFNSKFLEFSTSISDD